VHYKRVLNTRRTGLLQSGLGVLAVTDQSIAFNRDPLAGVPRTVQSQPFLFALARVEDGLGAEFIRHGYHQVLLFREWERFERPENA
jgi:hypothetical protein